MVKVSANVALACEEGRESVGNCGSFFRRRRSFTRISQASFIVRNHATKVKLKIRSKANCCFPSKDKCSNNSNLVPCPQRILRIPMALNELKITEQVKYIFGNVMKPSL